MEKVVILTENDTKRLVDKTVRKLLEENQEFNLDGRKNDIISYITCLIESQQEPSRTCISPIYGILTGNHKMGANKELGFPAGSDKKWKDFFSSSNFVSDGIWSQKNFMGNLGKKTGEKLTLNYYVTIKKEKNNIVLFVNKLSDLDKRLAEFSNKKQARISYKTHTILDAFITHNDSLKVFYYDKSIKNDIEKIVNDWIRENNIGIGSRKYSHGFDTKSDSGDKQSFGMILQNNIEKQLTNLIKQNGTKYTSETYFQWLKKNWDILVKPNIKY